ncbi:hypothetical protein Patl1_28916 [Pistacia atlantica]|uniref:Uncharacterized protein n=1 Tax=Pistacia atlantica TaxID=434234 RepID=A0ACC1BF43_9ROSI|nr:hypothetical protein Patl1_28916 [Pistacia atlantica]
MDDMATWSAARVVVVVLGWLFGGGRWISGACLLDGDGGNKGALGLGLGFWCSGGGLGYWCCMTMVYVEAIPVDFVEPITFLEPQPEDNEGFVRQDNEEAEEGILDIGVLKVIMKKIIRVGRIDREVGWLKE